MDIDELKALVEKYGPLNARLALLTGIEPQRLYRRTAAETREILGLSPTGIDEAVADGTLPPPVPLTKFGKSAGWYGFTLLSIIAARLEKAPARPLPTPKKKKKGGRS